MAYFSIYATAVSIYGIQICTLMVGPGKRLLHAVMDTTLSGAANGGAEAGVLCYGWYWPDVCYTGTIGPQIDNNNSFFFAGTAFPFRRRVPHSVYWLQSRAQSRDYPHISQFQRFVYIMTDAFEYIMHCSLIVHNICFGNSRLGFCVPLFKTAATIAGIIATKMYSRHRLFPRRTHNWNVRCNL